MTDASSNNVTFPMMQLTAGGSIMFPTSNHGGSGSVAAAPGNTHNTAAYTNNNMRIALNNQMMLLQLQHQHQTLSAFQQQQQPSSHHRQQQQIHGPPTSKGLYQGHHELQEQNSDLIRFPINNNNNEFTGSRSDTLESVSNAMYLSQAWDFHPTLNFQQTPTEEEMEAYGETTVDDRAGASAEDDSSSAITSRFRHYQADQWTTMMEKLIEFKRQHGHCHVPRMSKDLPGLGRWVKRQRYQYKLMQDGRRNSTMTPERAQVLEQVGFVWDAHGSTWHRRFEELRAFYLQEGHSNVPSNCAANPQLSSWVKFQRRQYKALLRNNEKQQQQRGRARSGASRQSLTPARVRALEQIGFQWELRKGMTSSSSNENNKAVQGNQFMAYS